MNASGETVLNLSEEDILSYIKNRPPMLMIDNAVVKPGRSSRSKRVFKEDEWFFKCHFPGNPLVPGVLQLEAMFNTAALAIKTLDGLKDKTSNISRIKNVSFNAPILPSDEIVISAEVVKEYRHGIAFFHAEISRVSDDAVLAKADFVLSIPDDMNIIDK